MSRLKTRRRKRKKTMQTPLPRCPALRPLASHGLAVPWRSPQTARITRIGEGSPAGRLMPRCLVDTGITAGVDAVTRPRSRA